MHLRHLALVTTAIAITVAGCNCQSRPVVDTPRIPFGDPCTNDIECEEQVCHHEDPAAEKGFCTRKCQDDCPNSYACQTIDREAGPLDICVKAKDTVCGACSNDRDCGDDNDFCLPIGGASFCAFDCREDPNLCPDGFSCRLFAELHGKKDVAQCVPTNDRCCIDKDQDLRGMGAQCTGPDCDDTNAKIYDDAEDLCDGLDNNCKNGVDESPTNCDAGFCKLGQSSYSQTGAQTCVAGSCVVPAAVDCGLYTCSEGLEVGDVCATACDAEDDVKCIPPAHCDSSACVSDFANGLSCDENSDCQSGHCQNGFCCANGDCCAQASDCPNNGVQAATCDTPASCQGSYGVITCVSNRCAPNNGLDNDTACATTTEANSCGFYPSVFCSGAQTQTQPACATSCNTNADCDANGYCHPTSKTCVEDLDNGGACGTDNDACKSGHCQNGFCCATGDCCSGESDCPSSYTSAPVCDSASTCQGTQDIARCVANTCSTQQDVANDLACTTTTLANDCGPYLPIYCSANATQTPPACPTSCSTTAECDANAYCTASGSCVLDEPNGNACVDDSACQSGHCQNGFCCATGDCCATNGNCGAYAQAAICGSQTTCQGTRVNGVCGATFQCAAATVDDDSACGGLQSNSCGIYPAISCTSAQTQPSDQASLCATSCTDDNGCDVSAHCDVVSGSPTYHQCVPDSGPGGFCNSPNDCTAGLFCTDNVCCTSACSGSCEACDLPGSVGTCAAVPAGQDPDAECPGVSCAAYYKGFAGDVCYRKADVTAAAATCGGNRACKTNADECTAQTAQGSAALTCNATCQDPAAGTCTGTTAGACTNVNPGDQTCGNGICQVTVAQCANGAPISCTPNSGAAITEQCNDVDDNCDGTIDNGAFSDSREPNNACSTAATLPTAASNQTLTATATLYPQGETDFFRIKGSESDSSCACCDFFCTDEDYQMTIRLTVPTGAGAYQFCVGRDNQCSGDQTLPNCQNVAAGTTASWIYSLDGACASNDDYSFFVKVTASASPGFECKPYTLSYFFDSGLCL